MERTSESVEQVGHIALQHCPHCFGETSKEQETGSKNVSPKAKEAPIAGPNTNLQD